jgi:tetratricopeptide (TPR) repeat protein
MGLAAGLLSLIASAPGVAAEPGDAIPRWSGTLVPLAARERPRLLRGDLDGYVDAIRRATDPKEWASLFVAGNLLYDVAPATALELHEAAAALAPDVGEIQLELGYDHQRLEQCDRAVVAWSAADRLGALKSPAVGLAAYCLFKTGRLDEGIALWRRVDFRAHHTGLDRAIHAVFGGPAPLRTHALLHARARGGDPRALRELIGNALDWRIDWWNAASQADVLDAVAALTADLRGKTDALAREVDCARRVAGATQAPAVRTAIESCRVLLDPHPYPVSSEVGKYLVSRTVELGLLDGATALARFGGELASRAASGPGDRAALEVLAFLQVRAQDAAGLARSDELGWRRYRLPEFALSRVAGLLLADDAAVKTQGRVLLVEALRDFPEDARLLRYDFVLNPYQGPPREAALLRLILAEYHGLQNDDTRSARTLRAFVIALAQARPPKP